MRRKRLKNILLAFVLLAAVCLAGAVIGSSLLKTKQIELNRALFTAIEAMDIPGAASALQNGADVNGLIHPADANGLYKEFAYYNHTPLIAACRMDDAAMVEMLIFAGADVNLADPWVNQPPLTWTLTNNKSENNANRFVIGHILVDHGADVDAGSGFNRPMESVLWTYETDSPQTLRQGEELYRYMKTLSKSETGGL